MKVLALTVEKLLTKFKVFKKLPNSQIKASVSKHASIHRKQLSSTFDLGDTEI